MIRNFFILMLALACTMAVQAAPPDDILVKGYVLDKDGTPLLRLVQAKDGNGFPAFETVEKVYDIAKMPTSAMQRIRGKEISMIFQEPMTSLNPLFTIGNQLDEVVLLHTPGAD